MSENQLEVQAAPKYFAHNTGKNVFLAELDAEVGTLVIGEEGGKFDAIVGLTPETITLTTYVADIGLMKFDIGRPEFKDLYIRQSGPQALHCLGQRQLLAELARRHSPRRSGESNSDRLLRLGQVLETDEPNKTEA